MALYAVDDHVLGPGSVAEVAALIEAKLESYDDAKTIWHLWMVQDSRNKGEVVAVLVITA
jgi:hypothetical protein